MRAECPGAPARAEAAAVAAAAAAAWRQCQQVRVLQAQRENNLLQKLYRHR